MISSTLTTTLLLLASPLLASAAGHEGGSHHQRAVRQAASLQVRSAPADNSTTTTMELGKRANEGASNARFTYYDTSVGLGACGIYHPNSEYTVALNSAQLSAAGGGYPNSLCGSQISITYNGKTTQATIQDECPTCPWGGLDLSMDLFTFFADHSVGVIYGTWGYGGGAAEVTTTTEPAWTPDPTTTTPAWVAPTTTTPAWTPEPTTTTPAYVAPTTTTPVWVAPTTTSTSVYVAPTSTYIAPASSSAAASSDVASSSGVENIAPSTLSGLAEGAVASASATATASTAAAVINNLEALGSFANGLGQVVCKGNEKCT